MTKSEHCYDLEDYKNLFTAIFKDIKTKEYRNFVIFADPQDDHHSINQFSQLMNFIEKECGWLIGYNSNGYDGILIKYLITHASRLKAAHPRKICEELYHISQLIVNTKRNMQKAPEVYQLQHTEVPFRSLDLMLLFNPVDRVSLKRVAITLRWHRIQDLPYRFDHIVTRDEISVILDYNRNDVDITELVKNELAENINTRIAYTIRTGTDIINSCNSQVGRKLLADVYEKFAKIPYNKFKDLETNYQHLHLRECIPGKVVFMEKEYKRVLKCVEEAVINPNIQEKKLKKKKPQFQVIVRSKYLTHTMGLGGVHSNGPAEIMEGSSHYKYIDLDVAGFYPWFIIREKICPAHLDPMFIDLFEEHVVSIRTPKFKKEFPTEAYVLKIGGNACFGNMDVKGDGKSWLKDARAAKSITIGGQIYLFMLMEALEKYTDCLVVYSNTDGLTVRVPAEQEQRFYNICKRWEMYLGFELEFKEYRKMIIRDVNNYMMFINDDKNSIKAIGAYEWKSDMAEKLKVKGVKYPIIPMAVREFYDKGTPVEDTIMKHTDIYDFMKAENTDTEKFHATLFHADDRIADMILQKNNRWIVTKGNPLEGRLMKVRIGTSERQEMQKGYLVTPANDVIDDTPITDYRLNYDFYIQQAKSLADLTQPLEKETHLREELQQAKLFA